MGNPVRKWLNPLLYDRGKRTSELCKAADFHTEWFRRWCKELGEEPNFHRKQWEYVYAMQALWERGCIQPGKKGLAFAVGGEPLPSVFAGYGCEVLATDIFPEEGMKKGWGATGQLCTGLEMLNQRGICDAQQFAKLVQYRAVDMTDIPADLAGYDFNWSSCSFEHLGSIEKGIDFLLKQMDTLKPGGWSVHTTEYNVSSDEETQDNNDTVIYRQTDINRIVELLQRDGHFVEKTDFSLGGMPEDFMVDTIPHQQKIHLKLQIGRFVATSIGLIIRKRA